FLNPNPTIGLCCRCRSLLPLLLSLPALVIARRFRSHRHSPLQQSSSHTAPALAVAIARRTRSSCH
ncbi:unnamed protein product, partial [Musa textilis]